MGLSKNVFVRREHWVETWATGSQSCLGAKGLQKCTVFLNREERVFVHTKGQGNENGFGSICCMSSTAIGSSLTSSPKALCRIRLSHSILFIPQIRNVTPTEVIVSFT